MRRIFKRQIPQFSIIIASLIVSSLAQASDFNLPFYNASELGDLYSGWAASATDASTAYSNPAGLTRLDNQQLVITALGIRGSAKFSGTTTNPLFPPAPPETGTASTKLGGILPSFYYAIPINDKIVLAFSETVPFALGTNYDTDSIVRYLATRTQIAVVDFGPSIGIKVNNKLAVGFGIDFNRMAFTINNMYGPPLSFPDSQVQNHLSGWGYGWHGGVLYQALPSTRIGLSFNSMVMYHTTGDSEVFGVGGSEIRTTNQRSNAALPARTQVSVHHDVNPKLAVKGTVFYTNWSTLEKVTMKHTMTPFGVTITEVIPFNYHNTFDYSLGLDYKTNEKWTLKAGVEFLTTPSNNHNRSVPDPIGCAAILGVGAHYQQNKRLGYDVSYAHGFFQDTEINPVTPLAAASGHSSQNTNVLGAQLTWNIA